MNALWRATAFLSAGLAMSSVSCRYPIRANQVSIPRVLTVRGLWIKDRDTRFNLAVLVRNDSRRIIAFGAEHIVCAGGRQSRLLFPHAAVQVLPGRIATVIVACDTSPRVEGRLSGERIGIVLREVQDEQGVVLARNVRWNAAEH